MVDYCMNPISHATCKILDRKDLYALAGKTAISKRFVVSPAPAGEHAVLGSSLPVHSRSSLRLHSL